MVKRGFKRTEVGEIPEDWEPETLESIAAGTSICYGIVQVGSRVPDGVPVLAIKNLERPIESDLHRCATSIEQAYARSRTRPGDVLVSVKGTIGRVGLVPAWFVGNISRDLARVRTRPGVSSAFIYQALRSPKTQQRFSGISVGTTRQELSIAPLKLFTIALPSSRDEQNAVAEALSNADALIESLEQLLAKKRAIKQGAMQSLLTGAKRLPGFVGAWTPRSFADLFTFSGGYSASREQLSSKGYCYLHYGDIHTSSRTSVDVHAEKETLPKLDTSLGEVSPSALLDDGDVVFVDASEDVEGTSKHVVVINADHEPFISGLHTIVAKPTGDDLDRTYRRFCFQQHGVKSQFRFYAVGTKVQGVSKSNIGKIQILLPSPPEQAAIAEVLTDLDADVEATTAKLDKARAVKQGMMQELLTGRIRLR